MILFALPAEGQQRKTATRKKPAVTATRKRQTTKRSTAAQPASIKGLQSERDKIKKQIRQHEQRLRNNERDVKKRLQNLMIINTEIADKRKSIDTIKRAISALDLDIIRHEDRIDELNAQLEDKKQKYVKSLRYMHRNRSLQNKLMFVFGAKNFSQMYRRLRFMREYATYQRVQGEMVKAKEDELRRKHAELVAIKQQKDDMLNRDERERQALETKQTEQQTVVSSLQRQQKEIQNIIDVQRKKDAALNAQIDRLIAIEVEKARARAAAEAKRKAEAEERRRREAEKAASEQAARDAENSRSKSRKKGGRDTRESTSEASNREKASATIYKLDSEDRRISGSFESNKGRLPMPVAGSYRIVSHFGQYNVEGLKGVRLDNKGMNIKGQAGAQVRSIFDGEVSAVFSFGGTTGVMVRHGSYISVYCNLASVNVHRGQKVSTRQSLGTVGQDGILQFQLRRETAKLNPEVWLGR